MRLFCAFFLKKGSISDQCYIDLKLTPLSTIERFGSRKSYGSNKTKVYVTDMVLSGTKTSGNNDLVSAEYAIALDGTNYRLVDVTANGKMTVGDDTFQEVNSKIKNKNQYQFNQ